MIRFRAFGAADLRDNDGNELRSVLSRPGQVALLAYLAVARPRGFHRRDAIIGVFWPDTGQDQARNALRQAVHRLRHELGADAVESRGAEELGLNPKVVWTDVGAFEDALAMSRTAEALAEYRGDLLPGFFLADAPDFEQWLERERARLKQRAAEAAWELSRSEIAAGRVSSASHWARWAYALNSDDESDLRKLIGVLVQIGDNSGAVRAYEEFAERVSREYEIQPSRATRELVEPLKSTNSAPTTTATAKDVRRAFSPYSPYVSAPTQMPSPPAGEAVAAPAAPAKKRPRWAIVANIAAGAALVAFALWRYPRRAPEPPSEAIAVFPFSVRGNDNLNYLREGMVDLLSAKLDGVVGLRSIDPRAILSASRNTDSLSRAQPQIVAPISRRLGAGAFVVGDVVELAGRVNVSGALYQLGDLTQPVAKVSVEGEVGHLAELVDELAGRLLAAKTKGRDRKISELAALTTESLPALTAFLEGESEFRAGHAEAARDAFRTAIREDTTFALAYIRLATTQGWSSASSIEPIALLAAARRNSARLSPLARQLLNGYDAYYHADGPVALELFTNLTRTYPDRVETWFMLGESYSHMALFTGHSPSEGRPAFERVLALDPDNPHALVHLARLAAAERNFDELRKLVARYVAAHGDRDRTYEMRALQAFALRDSAETSILLNEARRASTLDLYSMMLAANTYTENMPAASALSRIIVERISGVEGNFTSLLGLAAVAEVMQGHLGGRSERSGAPILDNGWSAILRSPIVADVPASLPVTALAALRDTVANWTPDSSDIALYLPFHPRLLQAVRAYAFGILSARLRDDNGVDSSVRTLSRLMRAANDSGFSGELLQLVRAERERNLNHPAEALREVDRFAFSPRHYMTMSFRPAYAHARFLRADLLHALGRDEEALQWYSSLSEQYDAIYLPLVHLKMGEILEHQRRYSDAARQYARFAELWLHADPELRAFVQRARVASDSVEKLQRSRAALARPYSDARAR